MNWLTLLIYIMTATAIAGALVIAALTAGWAWKVMVVLGLVGFIVAIPVAVMVGRKLT